MQKMIRNKFNFGRHLLVGSSSISYVNTNINFHQTITLDTNDKMALIEALLDGDKEVEELVIKYIMNK